MHTFSAAERGARDFWATKFEERLFLYHEHLRLLMAVVAVDFEACHDARVRCMMTPCCHLARARESEMVAACRPWSSSPLVVPR